jgi:hypothetical protein
MGQRPMKKNFRVVSLPDTWNKDHECHCNRCDKSFHASEMIFGRFENDSARYRSDWYCPTEDCHGRLFGGVYFLVVST